MNDPRPDATMWMADESIMPDFRATLEARLRQAASASVTPGTKAKPSHTHTRRFTALTAVAAILAIAIVVVAASDRHGAPAAYGRPLITLAPPVRHIPAARRRELAKLLDVAFGARLRHVWAIHALGGTAYLVQGDIGWCLQEPSHGPSNEMGGALAPSTPTSHKAELRSSARTSSSPRSPKASGPQR